MSRRLVAGYVVMERDDWDGSHIDVCNIGEVTDMNLDDFEAAAVRLACAKHPESRQRMVYIRDLTPLAADLVRTALSEEA